MRNVTARAESEKKGIKKTRWVWLTGTLVFLLLGSLTLSALLNKPLPLGFALDLTNVVIVQDANPQPPVAWIPKLSARV